MDFSSTQVCWLPSGLALADGAGMIRSLHIFLHTFMLPHLIYMCLFSLSLATLYYFVALAMCAYHF